MVKGVNIEILIFSQQEVHLCTWRPPTRDSFSSLAITTMTSIIITIIIITIFTITIFTITIITIITTIITTITITPPHPSEYTFGNKSKNMLFLHADMIVTLKKNIAQ